MTDPWAGLDDGTNLTAVELRTKLSNFAEDFDTSAAVELLTRALDGYWLNDPQLRAYVVHRGPEAWIRWPDIEADLFSREVARRLGGESSSAFPSASASAIAILQIAGSLASTFKINLSNLIATISQSSDRELVAHAVARAAMLLRDR